MHLWRYTLYFCWLRSGQTVPHGYDTTSEYRCCPERRAAYTQPGNHCAMATLSQLLGVLKFGRGGPIGHVFGSSDMHRRRLGAKESLAAVNLTDATPLSCCTCSTSIQRATVRLMMCTVASCRRGPHPGYQGLSVSSLCLLILPFPTMAQLRKPKPTSGEGHTIVCDVACCSNFVHVGDCSCKHHDHTVHDHTL
jgi:hypothetical protein